MRLRFTKMHGLGNDFVVIDGIHQSVALTAEQIRFIAHRHFGIGCDQVLVVERPRDPRADFLYRIYNSDGSEVSQCGNGARCFARFVHDQGLTGKDDIVVETHAGLIRPQLQSGGLVTVDLGVPQLEPAQIPIDTPRRQPTYTLQLDGATVSFSAVSLGNPHAVLRVGDVTRAPVATLGPQLESHPFFPQRVNVGFMEVVDRQHIRLRVFERGSGETMACGSGACAAVVAGRLQGVLDRRVAVELSGGSLFIDWQGEGEPVLMTGPATTVYNGEIEL
ncbi:MAG: diaminopimelate epimerase [Gammaproteobacteria bacterium]|nr:diaminopimelate epimerase [Gammaproteobacteria bacterium]